MNVGNIISPHFLSQDGQYQSPDQKDFGESTLDSRWLTSGF